MSESLTKAELCGSGIQGHKVPQPWALGEAEQVSNVLGFVFRPIWPEPEVLPVLTLDGGTALDLRKFLYVINERIEKLLSREQVIGHAYLLGLPATLDGVASAVRERILPLLEEYFFEDWSKIREVPGDPGRLPALQFIHQVGTGADLRYRLNPEAFWKVEAFIGVYGGVDDAHFPFGA